MKKLILTTTLSALLLSGCGGSGSETVDNALNDANDRYKNIEADVRDAYQKVENKLTDPEKSMAEILKGIFLPEESLDNFLDKITPEGGKGGLFVGYFVEDSDNDSSDSDVGAVYFDVGNDYAESVYGQMSYQQQACQDLNTLTTENISIKTDTLIGGVLSGKLDPAKIFDNKTSKFLQFDELNTNVIGMPFNGSYNDKNSSWNGQYTLEAGIDFGNKLASANNDCNVTYTLGNQGDFHVFPLNYKLGNLNANIAGTGSVASLMWANPANTDHVLVSQININQATAKGKGFVQTRLLKNTLQYTPIMTTTPTNYAFVIQAFDTNNQLIGYQAVIKSLPVN